MLEADGVTHRRDCTCPRCEAGFGPSEAQRRAAARAWEDAELRRQAERLLERRQARARAKALSRVKEMDLGARETAQALAAQRQTAERVAADVRLKAFLAQRSLGKSVSEALAEVERQFGAAPDGADRA